MDKLHPIQTRNIGVKELSIKAKVPPSIDKGDKGGTFSVSVSHSEYNHEKRVIYVTTRIEAGHGDAPEVTPFELSIEVTAEFSVDEDSFPIASIYDWANRNAPLILMPFLREHAFALTARCGFTPMLLPLFEVPTFTIAKSID